MLACFPCSRALARKERERHRAGTQLSTMQNEHNRRCISRFTQKHTMVNSNTNKQQQEEMKKSL